jgi:hypothetical protein
MLMRYHWGLSIGHVYTHGHECTNEGVNWSDFTGCYHSANADEAPGPPNQDQLMEEPNQINDHDHDLGGTDGSGSDSDDEDWVPSESHSEDNSQSSNDEYLADIDDMYGDGEDEGYEG